MNNTDDLQLKQSIAQAFSAAAPTYDQAACVEQEIGSRLLERLSYIKIKPLRVLDLGCGTGYFTQQLQNLFPLASIIGIDLALGMVNFASNNRSLDGQIKYYCADAESLPFADKSFDLIFSNCCFVAANNLITLSSELQRILAVDGLLLFSTLGPDTLKEFSLPAHWLDMHDIGDIFLKAQFTNPVVDTEVLTFTYSSLNALLQDLEETGNYQIAEKSQIANLQHACSATFEVIYGHAWGAQNKSKQFSDPQGNVYIPISELKYLKT